MAASSKYGLLTRSQLSIRLHLCERDLLRRFRDTKACAKLQAERADLFAALRTKDEEILARWEKGQLFGPGKPPALKAYRGEPE
jgi:hypothetical protein